MVDQCMDVMVECSTVRIGEILRDSNRNPIPNCRREPILEEEEEDSSIVGEEEDYEEDLYESPLC